jgi:excisionase family DNA binding protein
MFKLGDRPSPLIEVSIMFVTDPSIAALVSEVRALADLIREIRPPAPELYDDREVARRLGVCTRTVYDLRIKGELATVSIGSRRLVSADSLAAYVARQSATPKKPSK